MTLTYNAHTLSAHVIERLRERLNEDEVRAMLPRIMRAARDAMRSDTAFVSEPTQFHGQAWSDVSNGDRLVVVVRRGTVVTAMWRRSTQPFYPGKFRVDDMRELPQVGV